MLDKYAAISLLSLLVRNELLKFCMV